MCDTQTVLNIISTIFSFVALIVAGIGLYTWRLQLNGENKFNLSVDILAELIALLGVIDDYRAPGIFASEEYVALEKNHIDPSTIKIGDETGIQYVYQERWYKLYDQFQIYEKKMDRLKILLNDYQFDLVNNKRMKDFIDEIARSKFLHNMKIHNKQPLEDIETDLNNLIKIIAKVDMRDDVFGQEIEKYFFEMNRRLRKYIK